jgi:DNA-binding CsgD family transcriptional regulator
VAKTAPLDELLAAIRHAAIAGSSFTASGLGEAVTRRLATQGQLGISARETEVLGLLRDGLSIPAIAKAMFISRATAKTYVARLYDKLGAANRSQALMTAMHHGLITSRGTWTSGAAHKMQLINAEDAGAEPDPLRKGVVDEARVRYLPLPAEEFQVGGRQTRLGRVPSASDR